MATLPFLSSPEVDESRPVFGRDQRQSAADAMADRQANPIRHMVCQTPPPVMHMVGDHRHTAAWHSICRCTHLPPASA